VFQDQFFKQHQAQDTDPTDRGSCLCATKIPSRWDEGNDKYEFLYLNSSIFVGFPLFRRNNIFVENRRPSPFRRNGISKQKIPILRTEERYIGFVLQRYRPAGTTGMINMNTCI